MPRPTASKDPNRTPKQVFLACLKIEGAERRAAFLRDACDGDAELLERARALLQAHDPDGSFLAAPAVLPTSAGSVDVPADAEIGPYKLRERIGEGGFGEVWVADQREPVRREVAVKLLKPGMDSKEVLARFAAERQALALMQHPGIAQVYDGGMTPGGRPYFVMELVRGVRIDEYCDGCNLSLRDRLELFQRVCRAVQHAHQKGVIHRDLKPTNVLVAIDEGRPQPKVIDFGMAKALGRQLTDQTLHTRFAQMIGTPQYMSPEQAEMSALDVDTRSDVYSLGVLLYELLTGTTPLARERIRELTFDALRRAIREEEPQTPSGRVSTLDGATAQEVAQHRRTGPRRLAQAMRGDLDWIVMQALEKDRTRRYDGVGALLQDVERYQRDEPVAARPPSVRYRLGKFLRRNRGAVAAWGSVLAATAVVGVGLFVYLGDRAEQRRVRGQEVTLALRDVERSLGRDDWPRALASAEHAASLLARGSLGPDVAARVERWVASARLATSLEEVRQAWHRTQAAAADEKGDGGVVRSVLVGALARPGSLIEAQDTDRLYAAVFREHGLYPAADSAAAVRRMRGSPVRAEIIGALDDWAALRQIFLGRADPLPLLDLAQAIDEDPWRHRLRDVLRTRKRGSSWKKFAGKQALLDLAAEAPVESLPPATLLHFGEVLRYTGAVEQAVALLERARARHPGDYRLIHALAGACEMLKHPRYDLAVSLYTAAVAKRPLSVGVRQSLARALEKQGKPDRALAELRAAMAYAPRHGQLRFDIAAVLVRKGDLDAAAAEYRRAVAERGTRDSAVAHTRYPDALRRAGHPRLALAAYRELDARFPDFGWVRHRLVRSLSEAGSRQETVEVLGEMLARASRSEDYRRSMLGGDFMDNLRVNLLRLQGRWQELVVLAREVISRNPDSSRTELARALTALGDAKGARAVLEEAIEVDPECGEAQNNLGLMDFDAGRFDAAIARFENAIRSDPHLIPPHRNLVSALFHAGRLAEAKATLLAEPAFVETWRHGRDYVEAEFLTGVWLEAHPGAADVRALRAQVLMNLGRHAAAAKLLRGLLQDPEEGAGARVNLAVCLLQRKPVVPATRDEAIGLLQEVLRDDGRALLRGSAGVAPDGEVLADVRVTLASAMVARGAPGDREAAALGLVRALRSATSHRAQCQLVKLLASGQPDGAAAALEAAVRATPDAWNAWQDLGTFLTFTGEPARAAGCFREAIARDPKSWRARAGLAQALALHGDAPAARDAFAAILPTTARTDIALLAARLLASDHRFVGLLLADAVEAVRPEDPAPLVWRGIHFQRMHHPARAERAFRAALARDPGCREARLGLGEVLAQRGDRKAAIALYRAVIGDGTGVARDHFQLSQALLGDGDRATAMVALRKAVALEPLNAKYRYELAYLLQPDMDKARQQLRILLDQHPDHAEGLAMLGMLDLDLSLVERARQLAPEDASVLSSLAFLYSLRVDHRRAVECAEAAVRLTPTAAGFRSRLGEVLCHAGRQDEAIRELEQAIRLETPGNSPFTRSEARRFLARAWAVKGDHRKAIRYLEDSIRTFANNAAAHEALSELLAAAPEPERRDLDAALRHAEAAARLMPKNARYRAQVGATHADAGRLPEALKHLDQAIALGPKLAGIRRLRGKVLLAMGRAPEAKAELLRAVACKDPALNRVWRGELWLELVGACKKTMDYRDVVRFARAGLRVLPDSVDLHANLAEALVYQPTSDYWDPAGAARHADAAVAGRPGDALLRYVQGFACYRAARFEDAVRALQAATPLKSEYDLRRRFYLAAALFRRGGKGDRAAARECQERAAAALEADPTLREDKYLQSVRGEVERVLAMSRDEEVHVLLRETEGHRTRGAKREAAACLRRVVALAPKVAEHRTRLGYFLFELGRYPEAREQLEASLSLEGADESTEIRVWTRSLLGGVFQRESDSAQARRWWLAALELNPAHPETNFEVAGLLARDPTSSLYDPRRAIAHARSAAKGAPTVNTLSVLAIALWRRNAGTDREEAQRCFEQAVATGFERAGSWRTKLAREAQHVLSVPNRRVLALVEPLAAKHAKSGKHRCGLGMALRDARQWARANAAFRESLALGVSAGTATWIHNSLAWDLATCPDESVRDARAAVEHGEAAVQAMPKSATYRNTLGVAYYRAGRYADAVTALRASMNLSKGGTVVDWLFLGMALAQLGPDHAGEAREFYAKATARLDEPGARTPADHARFRKEADAVFGVPSTGAQKR